ncbi:AraC family transcriptional regulator [Mucilaginibacter pocheonensis]|uniref:AraC-like DNA-binding protein n=1 Tax=Mucilaginibacter pocheonensis TaxID=398050 RepID=A0ABU1TEQ0_9SPHI|nr:AraC family transcriptional regulator [Mucilaginibacter pocheonensis]MDR6943729.1 AraC-like DNA-binding protein [Mucilaginibacter pocheonensis]
MRAKQLFKELEVSVIAVDRATQVRHTHHFFQIIYVLEGAGIQVINGNRYPFTKDDVFLLTPDDDHSYILDSKPLFCVIDFTKNFFFKHANSKEEKVDVSDFFNRLEYIFHNQHNVKGNLVHPKDKDIFSILISQLISEKENERTFGKIITQNIIFLILNLIARNIQDHIIAYAKELNPKNKTHEIISYIQQHIFEKEFLSISAIAGHFNVSIGHLSRSFKEETGRTIKDYITKYKLEIIKSRLKLSDLTISQIAFEMNLADESHLNKIFKAAFGMTASQYRNS